MSIYIDTEACRALTVPETKVSVLHEVEIVWPDHTTEKVQHAEDVTHVFTDPANSGRHAYLAACLLASRVNTRLNFAPVATAREPAPDTPRRAKRRWRDWFAAIGLNP